MPDGPRERFEPKVNIEVPKEPARGFTAGNTSGVDAVGLVALNEALARLMARGMSEREAKETLHHAVAEWLNPCEAAEADVERLLLYAPGLSRGGAR